MCVHNNIGLDLRRRIREIECHLTILGCWLMMSHVRIPYVLNFLYICTLVMRVGWNMYTGSCLNFAVFFFLNFYPVLIGLSKTTSCGLAIRRLERPREVTGTLPRFLHLAEEWVNICEWILMVQIWLIICMLFDLKICTRKNKIFGGLSLVVSSIFQTLISWSLRSLVICSTMSSWR